MKKLITAILACVLLLMAVTACSGDKETTDAADTSEQTATDTEGGESSEDGGSIDGGDTDAPKETGSAPTTGSSSPNGTEAPADTKAPADNEVPAVTKAPEDTEAPAVTKAPEDTEAPADTDEKMPVADPVIHNISELNTTKYKLDTAVGNEARSTLAKDLRTSYTLDPVDLGGVKGYYPRIKKINDSEYIMIFHNGTYGGSIYCSRSSDCVNWTAPVKVFSQKKITVNGTSDNLKYMTPDACVLSDGRIMCVTSYRAEHTYYNDLKENGIVISFSSDNGKTWSAPQRIYTGLTWEPSALEADNGEIYVYFTAVAPTIHLYGYENRSSGVGLVRSRDGGKTWTPNVTGEPFLPQYVMRQYMFTNDAGVKKYNDQMPVALKLHNGTIALAVETYDSKTYKFSISYNNDGYKQDLGLDTSGPADRQTNLFSLAGPYLAQFDSGEVLLTYHWSGTMRYRLASANAKSFYSENTIHTGVGNWGSVETVSSHSAIMLIGTKEYSIKVARVYLNHDINATKMTPSLLADTSEWNGNTDAVFVSGKSQAQTSVRLAHDDDYVYILGERLDNYLTDKDQAEFYVSDGKDGQYIFSAIGDKLTVKYFSSKNGTQILDNASAGFKSRVTVCGTVNNESDTDNGILYELAIPKKLLDTSSGMVNFRVRMTNKDKDGEVTTVDDTNPSGSKYSWSRAYLK